MAAHLVRLESRSARWGSTLWTNQGIISYKQAGAAALSCMHKVATDKRAALQAFHGGLNATE